ncbi:MAG: hypothetical protein ACSHXY_00055 [Alphaproteobacteria bacterium]
MTSLDSTPLNPAPFSGVFGQYFRIMVFALMTAFGVCFFIWARSNPDILSNRFGNKITLSLLAIFMTAFGFVGGIMTILQSNFKRLIFLAVPLIFVFSAANLLTAWTQISAQNVKIEAKDSLKLSALAEVYPGRNIKERFAYLFYLRDHEKFSQYCFETGGRINKSVLINYAAAKSAKGMALSGEARAALIGSLGSAKPAADYTLPNGETLSLYAGSGDDIVLFRAAKDGPQWLAVKHKCPAL